MFYLNGQDELLLDAHEWEFLVREASYLDIEDLFIDPDIADVWEGFLLAEVNVTPAEVVFYTKVLWDPRDHSLYLIFDLSREKEFVRYALVIDKADWCMNELCASDH